MFPSSLESHRHHLPLEDRRDKRGKRGETDRETGKEREGEREKKSERGNVKSKSFILPGVLAVAVLDMPHVSLPEMFCSNYCMKSFGWFLVSPLKNASAVSLDL